MNKISVTGMGLSVILAGAGVLFFSPILFVGVGFAMGIILNNVMVKADNMIIFKKTTAIANLQQVQQIEVKKIMYSEKLYNKYTELKKGFNEYQQISVFNESATTALIQLERSAEKFERFIEILSSKFNQEELAYSKFFITVEQVYMAILENLDHIEDKLKGVGGRDYDYLIQRLENFEKMEKLTQSQLEEMSSIRQKKGMVKKEMKSIQEILAATEGVISNLDRVLVETSNLKTSSSGLDVSGTHAIMELEQLIKNAKMYNIG